MSGVEWARKVPLTEVPESLPQREREVLERMESCASRNHLLRELQGVVSGTISRRREKSGPVPTDRDHQERQKSVKKYVSA